MRSSSKSDKLHKIEQALIALHEISCHQDDLPEISEAVEEPRSLPGSVAFQRQLTRALLTLISVVAVVAALKSDAKTILDSLLPLLAFILGYYFPH